MGTIVASNLGKAYKQYPSRWGRLIEWISPFNTSRHTVKWVLRDVNFMVQPGEAVGIIGVNGAGKSTLLKIIAGTTQPTTGQVRMIGRVAALLELGMGFHPEFTGRQNAIMAGQLLGYSTDEILAMMDGIEDFAEIGDYIDQPLRTYSSGMQMRLAFSVVTARRPEILIVDEALSVGDAYFQHKCIDRIRRFRDQGTTLLFVSHSPAAIKSLCSRALLLEHGLLLRDGAPDSVLDYYNAIIAKQEADYKISQDEATYGRNRTTRSGNCKAQILGVHLVQNGAEVRAVQTGERVTVRVEIQTNEKLDELTVGFLLRDRLGLDVFGTNSWHLNASLKDIFVAQQLSFNFEIEELNLGVGTYSLTVALHRGEAHVLENYDWWDRAFVFQVIPGNGYRSVGVCYLPVRGAWSIAQTDERRSLINA